ncbi:hypothetical protein JVT61DRAFT_12570 [Boletus reticuloceps]|uniref:Flavin reductase like domain-containing protein n=1 Tax=Boletus reticuloceps TaxID=495285 RepID=A0A8I2YDW6_9AGAM|nr:hypothetical protein JVT61DRAFT_12570 [Boletus reticuloceps]
MATEVNKNGVPSPSTRTDTSPARRKACRNVKDDRCPESSSTNFLQSALSLMRLLHFTRRCIHTSTDDTRQLLRELLRESAQSRRRRQPSFPTPPTPPCIPRRDPLLLFLHRTRPLPLVAFSSASRLHASALNVHVASPSPSSAHFIITSLSAAQPRLATRFARPDLYPRPFADPDVHWTPDPQDGLPVFAGALGALSCRLVDSALDAGTLAFKETAAEEEGDVPQASAGSGLASELFIARVLRVERVPVPVAKHDEGDAGLYGLPLL